MSPSVLTYCIVMSGNIETVFEALYMLPQCPYAPNKCPINSQNIILLVLVHCYASFNIMGCVLNCSWLKWMDSQCSERVMIIFSSVIIFLLEYNHFKLFLSVLMVLIGYHNIRRCWTSPQQSHAHTRRVSGFDDLCLVVPLPYGGSINFSRL